MMGSQIFDFEFGCPLLIREVISESDSFKLIDALALEGANFDP